MNGNFNYWACTVKFPYVDYMKEDKKRIEVRTRIPKGFRVGDVLLIMGKGTYHLALVVVVESLTVYQADTLEDTLYRMSEEKVCATCLSREEILRYVKNRPLVYFIGISRMWMPPETVSRLLTPEYYGLKDMPQGIVSVPRLKQP